VTRPRRRKGETDMKIKVYAHTSLVRSKVEETFEISEDELEGLDEKERDKYIEESARDFYENSGMVGWGWEIVEPKKAGVRR
jgi:hypothetical protein